MPTLEVMSSRYRAMATAFQNVARNVAQSATSDLRPRLLRSLLFLFSRESSSSLIINRWTISFPRLAMQSRVATRRGELIRAARFIPRRVLIWWMLSGGWWTSLRSVVSNTSSASNYANLRVKDWPSQQRAVRRSCAANDTKSHTKSD